MCNLVSQSGSCGSQWASMLFPGIITDSILSAGMPVMCCITLWTRGSVTSCKPCQLPCAMAGFSSVWLCRGHSLKSIRLIHLMTFCNSTQSTSKAIRPKDCAPLFVAFKLLLKYITTLSQGRLHTILANQPIAAPTAPPEVFEGRHRFNMHNMIAMPAGKRICFFRMASIKGRIRKSGISACSPHGDYSRKLADVITVEA